MTNSISTNLDFNKETVQGLRKQEQKQAETLALQNPSQMTGLVWAKQAQAPEVQQTLKSNPTTSVDKPRPEILASNLEDVAILSTAVSMKEESVSAQTQEQFSLLNYLKVKINPAALLASFKETFKKSKSHNLLLERFMSHVKLGGLALLLSAAGIPQAEIENIKAKAREEALREIDLKLSQDWAYAKAVLDMVG